MVRPTVDPDPCGSCLGARPDRSPLAATSGASEADRAERNRTSRQDNVRLPRSPGDAFPRPSGEWHRAFIALEQDDFSPNDHLALASCLSVHFFAKPVRTFPVRKTGTHSCGTRSGLTGNPTSRALVPSRSAGFSPGSTEPKFGVPRNQNSAADLSNRPAGGSPQCPTPRRSVGSGAVAKCRPRPNRLLLVQTLCCWWETYVAGEDLRCCYLTAV